MAISPRSPRISDFDPSEFLAGHEQHERTISELTERTFKLEQNFATPQAVASFFQECAKDSRNLENVFAQMFCRFLDDNSDVKDAIQKRISDADRNFFFKTLKRFGLASYSLFLVILGAAGKELVQWLLSIFPHAPK
jgi:hypothetical protein